MYTYVIPWLMSRQIWTESRGTISPPAASRRAHGYFGLALSNFKPRKLPGLLQHAAPSSQNWSACAKEQEQLKA